MSINNVFGAKVTDKPFSLGFSKETVIAVALGVVAGLGALYYYKNRTSSNNAQRDPHIPVGTSSETKSEQSSNTQLALTGAEKLPFASKSRTDFIKDLPEDMVLAVSEFLAPEDLARVSCVNKECRALVSAKRLWDAFDLPKLYPGFSVIDEKVWREHVDVEALKINPAGARPLSNRELIPVVAHVSNKVEGKKGVTLFTIPKDFTINKALELARDYEMPIDWIWGDILTKIGDIPVDDTYQIAITNSVLEGSRDISFTEQEDLVKKLRGTVPDLRAAIAFIVLKYITSF